ncbi:hypothetical protein ANO14919_111580 [Xylariales sp. No.14919]|nr:hypothetical protein ANO14919_111580 [Xylariales sp. No.14919]
MARRIWVAIDPTMAMRHIHDRGIIWGDVSTRNILVFDDLILGSAVLLDLVYEGYAPYSSIHMSPVIGCWC